MHLFHNSGRWPVSFISHDIIDSVNLAINRKMAAIIGSIAAVNVFLESDEDDDLQDITTSPAIQSFFNIHLLT